MNSLFSMWLLILNNALVEDATYNIAQYFIVNYKNLDKISISKVASDCLTSPATINKFCRQIGFQSYQDLKSQVKYFYQIRMKQMEHRFEIMDDQKLLNYLDTDAKKEFQEQIDQIAKLIYEAKQVRLVGATYPLALAQNFQEDLIMMGKLVFFHQCLLFCDDVSFVDDELVIIVSLTGRIFTYNQNLLNKIFNSKCKVILISQNLCCNINDLSMYLQLPGLNDSELVNFSLLATYYMIKNSYYHNFYHNNSCF
ncbi:MurR/RpiR family transcriptional regulator [Thomasclavelia saccharogumia]|uniref:MurR/RpiR family transcriptional regulator n=1 Tax=Thomasclavelia saccharogumia TaxID=341225 RepID=UPI00047C7CCA|nr:MurR/RpiR family transcriptional regulator [Thomasclavelia saccharogumia]